MQCIVLQYISDCVFQISKNIKITVLFITAPLVIHDKMHDAAEHWELVFSLFLTNTEELHSVTGYNSLAPEAMRLNHNLLQIPALHFTSCRALCKYPNFSILQFLHLQIGDNNSTYRTGLLCRLYELILRQCLIHTEYFINFLKIHINSS